MTRRVLTEVELSEALPALPGWTVVDGWLTKQFKFGSFAEAMGWMVSVAIRADKMDHHPNWSNVYNRVDVQLKTHDLDALSTFDLRLAGVMEEMAGEEGRG